MLASAALLHVREADIAYPCRVKSYPDGSVELLACSKTVFKPDGWENSKRRLPSKKSPSGDKRGQDGESLDRAMRRARAQVKDLALCTNFKYFVTLTLNREKVDRYDIKEVTRIMNRWLDNRVRRNGLAYVLVPERHKDGAIHFHGFFNDALPVVDSGHKDCKGHTVYNLPSWTLGFTTAIELYGDYQKAVGYVCKYIGKQGEKPGGRWYYSGGKLGRPDVSYEDIGYREVEALDGAYCFSPEGSGLSFAMVRIPPQKKGELEACTNTEQVKSALEPRPSATRQGSGPQGTDTRTPTGSKSAQTACLNSRSAFSDSARTPWENSAFYFFWNDKSREESPRPRGRRGFGGPPTPTDSWEVLVTS